MGSAVLCVSRNSAAVEREYHSEKQDKSGSEKGQQFHNEASAGQPGLARRPTRSRARSPGRMRYSAEARIATRGASNIFQAHFRSLQRLFFIRLFDSTSMRPHLKQPEGVREKRK